MRHRSDGAAAPYVVPRVYGDCTIASLATVTGRSYEAACELLNVEVQDGKAQVTRDGLGFDDIGARLAKIGIRTRYLAASQHPLLVAQRRPGTIGGGQIRNALQGHLAIVSAWCFCECSVCAEHSFPWLRDHIVDDRVIEMAGLRITGAQEYMIGPIFDALIIEESQDQREGQEK